MKKCGCHIYHHKYTWTYQSEFFCKVPKAQISNQTLFLWWVWPSCSQNLSSLTQLLKFVGHLQLRFYAEIWDVFPVWLRVLASILTSLQWHDCLLRRSIRGWSSLTVLRGTFDRRWRVASPGFWPPETSGSCRCWGVRSQPGSCCSGTMSAPTAPHGGGTPPGKEPHHPAALHVLHVLHLSMENMSNMHGPPNSWWGRTCLILQN